MLVQYRLGPAPSVPACKTKGWCRGDWKPPELRVVEKPEPCCARERQARLMAAGNTNPYMLGWSCWYAAVLHNRMREYGQAEALAAQALELSEQINFHCSQ